ncbi:MAG: hypothetical protein AAF561_03710 [Planctomycetota bacterium]
MQEESRDMQRVLSGVTAAIRQRVKHDAEFAASLSRVLGLDSARSLSEPPPREAPEVREPVRSARSFNEFFDAELVAKRCRLKALAARWQVVREAVAREGVRPVDDVVLAAGRELPDCYLWMCNAQQSRQRDEPTMERVARCYEALAEAAELVGPVDIPALEPVEDDADAKPSAEGLPAADHVQLLAEAQSALHVALGKHRTGGGFDADQMSAYVVAKEFGGRRRVFFRNLAREDRADPDNAADLTARIHDADAASDDRRDQRIDAGLSDLRKTITAAEASAGDGVLGVASHELALIRVAIMRLMADGLATDDPRLSAAASSALDLLPEEADAKVLGDEIDAVFAAAEEVSTHDEPAKAA